MTDPVRRAGRFSDDAARTVTWSVADGSRGRRWRWTVVDRRGTLVVAHTLETAPDGAFVRLESVTAAGLLTLHREADGSMHGNRVAERGVDHLTVEAPVPEGVLIGASDLSAAVLLRTVGAPAARVDLDVVEISDDLGLRISGLTIRPEGEGAWVLRTSRRSRLTQLGPDGLPEPSDADAESWPLERP